MTYTFVTLTVEGFETMQDILNSFGQKGYRVVHIERVSPPINVVAQYEIVMEQQVDRSLDNVALSRPG